MLCLARDPELVRRHRLDPVLRRQLRAPDGHVEARLDDLIRPFEVVALLRDHHGARLRDHELALLERQVGVGLLDDLGLALGPPFGDAAVRLISASFRRR
jgi:hypothetical protein